MTTGIVARDAGVRFQFDAKQRTVTPRLSRLRRGVTETWGLRRLTFTIEAGEAVALLGPSGAGKSTLLRLMAGVFAADEGTLEVRGTIGTLLSIEAGLMGMLTGRENAALIGVLNGMGFREARAAVNSIRDESGLGDAFERPVGSYSQGMRAQIGLTIAQRARPSVLLLDEVHEALDHDFRARVEQQAQELVAAGGIVVAAGHDHPLLERICTRALLMRNGTVVDDGPFADVQARYLAM